MNRLAGVLASLALVGLLLAPGASAAVIAGTPGPDVLVGTPGPDKVNGKAGNDTVDGGAGSDNVQAASGNDIGVYGLDENAGSTDVYKGGQGVDQLQIIVPDDVTPAEVAQLQDAVDAYNAFLATVPGEGNEFDFSGFGFGLRARGFEDLETNAVAVDDAYTTDEDSALNVGAPGVMGNDINLDGDPLAVIEVDGAAADVGVQISLPSGALVTLGADGSLDYDPNGQFESLAVKQSTTDTFAYTMTDGTFSSSATVEVEVTGMNDAPVAQDVSATVSEDGPPETELFDGDDIDADDTQASLTYSVLSGPAKGQLTNNNDGSWTFDPDDDFESLAAGSSEDVSFTYEATDKHSVDSNTATGTITVDGENDAPVADDATFSVDEDAADGTVVGTVTASDVDTGDTFSFAITGGNVGNAFSIGSASGTITVNDPPGLDFDTLAVYNLTVTVTDLLGASGTAAVTINVDEVAANLPPTADDINLAGTDCLLEGAPAPFFCNVAFPAGTLGGTDPNGDGLTVGVVAHTGLTFPLPGRTCNAQGLCTTDNQFLPASSTLTVNADGSFSVHYETDQCPVFPAGNLILEFEYTVTEVGTPDGFSDGGIATLAAKAKNDGCN